MELIWNLEISAIIFLQHVGYGLFPLMKGLTFLGSTEFFILVLPAIYWCFDSRLGLRLSVILLLGNGMNFLLKTTFRFPRPFWFDSRVIPLSSEKSFGMPSGHAQNTLSLFGMAASQQTRKKVTLAAGILILLIGISRIYLGVHFITDVLSGWIIGFFFLMIFLQLEKRLMDWFQRIPFFQQIIICCAVSLGLFVCSNLAIFIDPIWNAPEVWQKNASRIIPVNEFHPLDMTNSFFISGTFLGIALGALFLRHYWGDFDGYGSFLHRIFRYFTGIAGLLLLWFGTEQLFSLVPESTMADFASYFFHILGYTLIGLWITWLAPLLFSRVGWLQFKNQPNER